MDVDDARTIGRRVRQIRLSRGKSLRVVAGLAGMSKSKLSLIERGELALDRRSDIVALANALHVAPSELTKIDLPAPGNGHNDVAVEAVRHSLMAVSRHRPGGQVLGIEELRSRVRVVLDAGLGLAVWGDGLVLLADGEFELARAELEAVTVPTNTPESMQLAGMLALCRSLVAAADQRPADAEAALDHASELAEHTGEGNAYWLGFGPTNVGLWRMAAVLEASDYERAVTIAERLNPRVHPNRSRQAAYWIDYGRALARLRGRQDAAVMALRRGETLSALHMQRNPFVREVLGGLLVRSRRDAVGRELRGMAYRAGLPV
ncbi:MAG: helix-turn-helix domain-containing protein [Pseudonocardiales bacterium]|nr:helix-turn-helix domain-containing protein [Pseudonocardiales bacterium]